MVGGDVKGAFDDVRRGAEAAEGDGGVRGARGGGPAARARRGAEWEVGGKRGASAEAQYVKLVEVGGKAKDDGAVRVAWPAWHWPCGESGGGEAAAGDYIVDDAGGGGARADTGADRASGSDDLGVEALSERGLGEEAGTTWKSPATTSGRARERASAPIVARIASFTSGRRPPVTGDEVAGVKDERIGGAGVDFGGDGVAGEGDACADGSRGSVADENADAAAGA